MKTSRLGFLSFNFLSSLIILVSLVSSVSLVSLVDLVSLVLESRVSSRLKAQKFKVIMAPESDIVFNADLIMPVEAPFHVIADELFHQLRPVGIQESTYHLRKDM